MQRRSPGYASSIGNTLYTSPDARLKYFAEYRYLCRMTLQLQNLKRKFISTKTTQEMCKNKTKKRYTKTPPDIWPEISNTPQIVVFTTRPMLLSMALDIVGCSGRRRDQTTAKDH